jgi:hypothetical protein
MTVPQNATTRKAYRAHLYEQPGLLYQDHDGRIMFLADATDQVTPLELVEVNFLTVLGRCDLASIQRLDDLYRGGAVGVALGRPQEAA